MSQVFATLSNQIEVQPLSGSLGAEVLGVDLAQLDDGAFDAIYSAFVQHQVVVFRDQDLTPEQYLAFAHRWGGIHPHPFMKHLEEYPGILEIIKTETDTKAFGNGWHSDQMFVDKPSKCTMLYAKEVPATGGDTLFANLHDAYDALSDGMKTLVGGLKGWNTGDRQKLRARASQDDREALTLAQMEEKAPPSGVQTESVHPLVRTHADSGRKALYLGGHTMRIDGMSDEESAPLLNYLKQHAVRPEFTCRVGWEVGSLTIWDNRCVQHYALNDYQGQRRRMHRITIEGQEVPY
ncbi:MAG: taurine dioxygenase [Chromatiales bacterium]|nr:taurine dioxygenase [Chromatiales bacterium]